MRHDTIRSAGIALLLLLTATAAWGALPAGKVLVIQATAIEGLAAVEGPIDTTRTSSYALSDDALSIDRKALASLDGVQALFLVDHRRDQAATNGLARRFSQDVRALTGGNLSLDLLPALELEYQLGELDGQTALLGDGGRLFAEGGAGEPYLVWRIDGMQLMDRDALSLR